MTDATVISPRLAAPYLTQDVVDSSLAALKADFDRFSPLAGNYRLALPSLFALALAMGLLGYASSAKAAAISLRV